LVGTGAEVLGIYSGYPFGHYTYTARWWPTIQLSGGYSFPILVPFAWFLVAGGCALALKPIGKSSLVFAPMVATLIDFFMEPVMVRTLGYWRWLDPGPLPGGAPWLNVAGWFGTSFLATWVLSQYKSAQSDDPPWIVIGFVLLLAGLWLIPGKLAT
jgi:putative membrane protein